MECIKEELKKAKSISQNIKNYLLITTKEINQLEAQGNISTNNWKNFYFVNEHSITIKSLSHIKNCTFHSQSNEESNNIDSILIGMLMNANIMFLS
jgi:hypothetical protein